MNVRDLILNGLVDAHHALAEAKADYSAAAGELLKYTETKTHIDDRISLPAVFTDADNKTWIIHHAGSGGLVVRPGTPYSEGASL